MNHTVDITKAAEIRAIPNPTLSHTNNNASLAALSYLESMTIAVSAPNPYVAHHLNATYDIPAWRHPR